MQTKLAAVFVAATLAVLGTGAATTSQSQPALSTSPRRSLGEGGSAVYLAALHREIEAIEQQLAKVEALESQVAQLERTIQIITPMLADRSRARRGDVDGNGVTDSRDLRIWSCCTGVAPPTPNSACWFADVNVDGQVDLADRVLIETAIGKKDGLKADR